MAGYFHHYLRSAVSLLQEYEGREPFSVFLKSYFKKNKKFGSRDRKIIGDLCFGYLRIGQAAASSSIEEQIKIGFYLTHQSDNGFLEAMYPAFLDSISQNSSSKLEYLKQQSIPIDVLGIFPFSTFLSSEIDPSAFGVSHLQKSLYFIKIRPGKKEIVMEMLQQHHILCKLFDNDVLGFDQNIDLSAILKVDEDIVVQDISSQKTMDLLKGLSFKGESVWDACAGGGGKSILVADQYSFKTHIASDIRPSILEELSKRMKKARVDLDATFCVDLANSLAVQVAKSYLPKCGMELIIADVPCSGSGTWGRAPEWLRLFDPVEIDTYHRKQVSIIENLLPLIKKNGYLLYITCSVFEKENEGVLKVIKEKHEVNILESKYIVGFPQGGDQLFTALITL
jgi:16S rRNA (cytosine967-C5)-methyltransferase